MNNRIRGKCFAVGDEISSLQIIGMTHWQEKSLGDWVFDSLFLPQEDRAGLFRKEKCNIVVAGRNFGCGGKSNDFAVMALRDAGVEIVIAAEFNRIFYRLAIDLGLPVLICPEIADGVRNGDELDCDVMNGIIIGPNGTKLTAKPPDRLAAEILQAGGLIEYCKHRDRPEEIFPN